MVCFDTNVRATETEMRAPHSESQADFLGKDQKKPEDQRLKESSWDAQQWLSFFQYAKSKGVSVFYITNRLEAERAQTLQELQRWNFPDATNDHLILKTAGSGKGPRRDKVSATHEIIMLFGDNLSDFSSVFDKQLGNERDIQTSNNAAVFGSKFIVLPNVMYGDWEGALYNYRYALPVNQKDSVIIGGLRKY